MNKPAAYTITEDGDLAYLRVGTGEVAVIDRDDVALACQHRWARRHRKSGAAEIFSTTVKQNLSRVLMTPGPEFVVDHLDGDPLNNRRCNLRVCTIAENNRNTRKVNKPGFKGVRLTPFGKWAAYGTLNKRHKHIGTFFDPISAAYAYDDFARRHFGEFACVNYPVEGERGALTADQTKMAELQLHEGLNSPNSGA